MSDKFQTPQEEFWAGSFGEDYILRNEGKYLLASNLNFFNLALKNANKPNSVLEFGANIGMNLKALKLLYPDVQQSGIEINENTAIQLAKNIGGGNVINKSIFDYKPTKKYDICLIKGVLIHINPDMVDLVYQKLFDSTNSYILICEYYNPTPVKIDYRGHQDRLFKRDFAGEMLEKYPSLELVDYGFSYKRDKKFPQDDITWFLLKK